MSRFFRLFVWLCYCLLRLLFASLSLAAKGMAQVAVVMLATRYLSAAATSAIGGKR